jgi:hypothetical protein
MSSAHLFLDYMEYKARMQKREHVVRSIYKSERVVQAVAPLTYSEYHNLLYKQVVREVETMQSELNALHAGTAHNIFGMRRGQLG